MSMYPCPQHAMLLGARLSFKSPGYRLVELFPTTVDVYPLKRRLLAQTTENHGLQRVIVTSDCDESDSPLSIVSAN